MRVLRAWPVLLRVAWAEMFAYRAEMVVWILGTSLPLVMLALWDAAAESGALAGFTAGEVARYFTAVLVVRQLTAIWLAWEFDHDVRTGALSPQLLRPMHPLWWRAAETLAAVPWRVVVLVPLLGALGAWRPEAVAPPDVATCGVFALSLALAWLVGWCVQVCFGCLAFWFEQALGAWQAWFFAWGLLSGYLVPLALMPPSLRDVAAWLPFYATLGAPVDLLLGHADPWGTLARQGAWAIVLAAVASAAWRAGMRRYGAVGA
ncbi:MAG: hypothetical protein RLZZ299_2570 [Pseudomonadota bacterium]|jgi:ABC-2 type transport system permease protein